MNWFRVKLWNLWMYTWCLFTKEPMLQENDGRWIPMNSWSGYNHCMRPGCGHYRCEHEFGEDSTVLYVAPHLVGVPGVVQVGDTFKTTVGCANAGCDCEGFWSVEDLMAWSNNLSFARINIAYAMSQVSNVLKVRSQVETTVRITSVVDPSQVMYGDRTKIFEAEREQLVSYPEVPIAFHISLDN